jgi:outer membrane receptor for ferrienterochelin and colicin
VLTHNKTYGKKSMVRSFCAILLIYLGCITPLIAEEVVVFDKELQELLALDVEDLSAVSVSVASKHDEKIRDTLGIVTVITAEEIQRYGYRNPRDILDHQTHIQIIGSNLFTHGRVSMRRSTFTHTDNTILPLLI